MPLILILSAILSQALTDTLQLQAAGVTAKVEPVTVVADTVVYNAEAFKLRDDATLEDLLLKIPGLEINGSKITLYGKAVDKLMLNGQDFFGSNPSAGLKNLDAQMVKGIRNYARESDFTRLTGIDDGEETNVLDISVKKSFMDGWKSTLSGGYGTSDRFTARGNAGKISKSRQTTAIAGINNLPSKPSLSNTNFNTLGSGGTGDRSRWEAGLNHSETSDRRKLSASGHYSGNNSWIESVGRSESVLPTGSSSSASENGRKVNAHNVTADFKGEWKLAPRTTLLVHPDLLAEVNRTGNDGLKSSFSGAQKLVNTSASCPSSSMDRVRGRLDLQLAQRFKKRGRSASIRVNGTYDCRRNGQADSMLVTYFKNGTTPYKYDRRTYDVASDTRVGTLGGTLSYSEPLAKHFLLDFYYKADFRSNYLDRDVTLNGAHNAEMTSEGRYDYFAHTVSVSGRYVRKKFNVQFGVNLIPQTGTLHYKTELSEPDSRRSFVFNAAPKLLLRYRPKKTESLRLEYITFTGTPSVYNLIPVVNGTNPLYVHIGNPDLKPSFTQRLKFEYNFSAPKSRQSLVLSLQGQTVGSKTVNSTAYDPETGIRTTTPVNVDGNWTANFSAVYNKSFPGNAFSMNAQLYSGYNNEVSYLYNSTLKQDELSRLGRFQANGRVKGIYRNSWLDLGLAVGAQVTDERSFLREDLCQTPWRFNTDVNASVFLPWNMKLGLDYSYLLLRGNLYEEYNRGYHLLGAYISQSFFKGRLVASITGNDLLGQQENQVRSFSASTRSITVYNGVSRYLLLKLLVRF